MLKIFNNNDTSKRIIRTLSTTQKILMIASFIASELDTKYDTVLLRNVKKTMIKKRRVKNLNLKSF